MSANNIKDFTMKQISTIEDTWFYFGECVVNEHLDHPVWTAFIFSIAWLVQIPIVLGLLRALGLAVGWVTAGAVALALEPAVYGIALLVACMIFHPRQLDARD